MKTTDNNDRQVNKLKVFPKKKSDNKERERRETMKDKERK
jgi:hypothetical protein